MITTLVIALLASGGLLLTKGLMWGGYLLGVAIIMFGLGLKNIPAVPPSKGLVTIWGARKEMVISEGYTILALYFPFFCDAILINVEQKNQDFIVEGLRCNAQGQFQGSASVKVKVGITWQPDSRGDRLYNYVGVGNEQGRAVRANGEAKIKRRNPTLKEKARAARPTRLLLQSLFFPPLGQTGNHGHQQQAGHPAKQNFKPHQKPCAMFRKIPCKQLISPCAFWCLNPRCPIVLLL